MAKETTFTKEGNDNLEENEKETETQENLTPKDKRRKREIIKNTIKEDSGLSFIKVCITVLTAVSMALISSKLTGFVNSLMLVALVSIGSAVMTEFYRIVLSLTSISAKKVVLPVTKFNPDGTTKEIQIESTQNEYELTNKETKETSLNSAQDNDKDKSSTIITTNDKNHSQTQDDSKTVIQSVKNYFQRSPMMKMALLFTVISLLTIGANYFITTHNEKGATVEHTSTTVHKTEAERLSDQEKEDIINSAVNESKEDKNGNNVTSDTSENNKDKNKEDKTSGSNDKSVDKDKNRDSSNDEKEKILTKETIVKEDSNKDLSTQVKDLKSQNNELKKRLEEIEKNSSKNNSDSQNVNSNNNSDAKLIKTLQDQISTLEGTIDSLQKQLDEMEEKLDDQQANSGGSQSYSKESNKSKK